MSKNITKNLKKLDRASETISKFQKFCYTEVKGQGLKDFLRLYVRVLFEHKTHQQKKLVGKIKSNLEKLSSDIIANEMFGAFEEKTRRLRINNLKEYLSEITKGWPVKTVSIDRKEVVGYIPPYLILNNILHA